MKPVNVLRQGIGIIACGGLIATWTFVEGNPINEIAASLLIGRALWGVGTGTITLKGQEVFFEDRPYRFCILMFMLCLIGIAIAFWRQ